MSVITQAYASPSRVMSVVRYFLSTSNKPVLQKDLELFLSPKNWVGQQDEKGETAHLVINELINMELLFKDDGDFIQLTDELSGADEALLESILPATIIKLSSTEDSTNHDFVKLLAWYVSQNPYMAPGNWDDFQRVLDEQVGSGRLGCTNDARYGQFEDWCIYCGFGWQLNLDGRKRLVPDPTKYLRTVLPLVFESDISYTVQDFLQQLSKICPVFELGPVRTLLELEGMVPLREASHLSYSTSLSLLRLEREGFIQLSSLSDGDVFLLQGVSETGPRAITHIVWKHGVN